MLRNDVLSLILVRGGTHLQVSDNLFKTNEENHQSTLTDRRLGSVTAEAGPRRRCPQRRVVPRHAGPHVGRRRIRRRRLVPA